MDGFRYLPPNVKGRFRSLVVGLRALADGTFVQDVEVGFHELLMALCLIPSSCKPSAHWNDIAPVFSAS